MKTYQRLFLLAALIVAELLCAQPTPPEGAHGPRRGGPGGRSRFHPVLRVLDADRDGGISASEIAAASTALASLDADADGSISTAELRPAPPAVRPAPPTDRPGPPAGAPRGRGGHSHPVDPVMLALDADGDGALSAAEISRAPASLQALDANHDGKLTRDELHPLPPVE